ncbi:hypothetical protein ACFYZ4_38305 [Streptomyces sp. NPDC001513]|uniref:hypothetical protein n=1 Tax=Streptomyces sp. NPDC001513 TaxID=3364580 RepID=UPI0036B6A9B7
MEDFEMTGWRPPVTADISLTALPRHRLDVRVASEKRTLAFSAAASAVVRTRVYLQGSI